MAIPALKTKRTEWTRTSVIQMCVAGILVLLSLVLVMVAVRRFGLKRSFAHALIYYHSNRVGNVIPALTDTLEWDEGHHVARELLAKACADEGKLDQAEDHYRRLLEASDFDGKGIALYGLGVVAFKKAEREKEWKAAEPLVQQARKYFADAKLQESEIALRHCDILTLVRTGLDATKAKTAAEELEKILNRLVTDREKGAAISREGLIDLYAALGWSTAMQGGLSTEAARYFRTCFQYGQGWALPRVNMVYFEARRFAETDISLEDLRKQERSMDALRTELRTLSKTRKEVHGALEEPWLQYTMAGSLAFGRKKGTDTYNRLMYEIRQDEVLQARVEPHLVDTVVAYEPAVDPAANRMQRNGSIGWFGSTLRTFQKCEQLAKPEFASLRAAVLHNLGFVFEHQAVINRQDTAYDDAIKHFKQALEIEESYEGDRNIAVIQKRRNKPDAQEWLDKALRAAEKRPEAWVKQDVEELKKFFAEGGS
ncbi:MAG: tetratricopeptide repeat protein [Planctomycetes bacterium]|nr:tetratricopeptide repeat protein [Planctomycetota bacterium]